MEPMLAPLKHTLYGKEIYRRIKENKEESPIF